MPVAIGFKLEPVAVDVNVLMVEELAVEVDAADVIVILVAWHDATEMSAAIANHNLAFSSMVMIFVEQLFNYSDTVDAAVGVYRKI